MDPATRAILRIAAYQALSLDRIPAHAIVSEAVEQAKRSAPEGAAGFVNAVLRRAMRREAEAGEGDDVPQGEAARLARAHSFPEWIVARWLPRYGPEETEAMLAIFNRPPTIVLRVNRTRAEVQDVIASLAREGVRAEPGRLFPEDCVRFERAGDLRRLDVLRRGLATVQDESSLLAATLLVGAASGGGASAGSSGLLVLDVAAAPGGKATHLAECLSGRSGQDGAAPPEPLGRVVANDRSAARAEAIAANAERLGLSNLSVRVGDARDLPEEFRGRADRVLADVPCSGLGVLHRRADARWRRKPEDVETLARLELEIALAAADCLAPGGVLVYSTCTTEPEENEAVVERLLRERPDLAPADLRPHLPPALRGEPGARDGRLQLLPQRHGVDGFFAARLERVNRRERTAAGARGARRGS